MVPLGASRDAENIEHNWLVMQYVKGMQLCKIMYGEGLMMQLYKTYLTRNAVFENIYVKYAVINMWSILILVCSYSQARRSMQTCEVKYADM